MLFDKDGIVALEIAELSFGDVIKITHLSVANPNHEFTTKLKMLNSKTGKVLDLEEKDAELAQYFIKQPILFGHQLTLCWHEGNSFSGNILNAISKIEIEKNFVMEMSTN